VEEVQRISKALKLVEQYEDYLFRRAWGMTFIALGLLFPLNALLILKAESIAGVLGMGTEAFTSLASTIIALTIVAVTLYLFTSATVVLSRRRKFSFSREMPHALAISLTWFVCLNLTRFVPERFAAVSWLWATGCASLLSYIILWKVQVHTRFQELYVTGLSLLIASLPIAFVTEAAIAEPISLTVFSVAFVAGGIYSILTASRILGEGEKEVQS
jgi:hypothetical protein